MMILSFRFRIEREEINLVVAGNVTRLKKITAAAVIRYSKVS